MKTLKLFGLLLVGLFLGALLPRPVHADPATGVYRLTTRGNQNMALDITGFGNGNSTTVQLWYANHTSNQQWLVEAQGDGTYKIYAYSGRNSVQMLDDNNGGIGDGNAVTTYQDYNNTPQRWYFKDIGGGYYRIIPAAAGPNGTATLDMTNGNSATAGSTANIYTYYGGDNQVFKLDWAGVAQTWVNGKKGIGGRDTKTAYMNCSWYYNWGESLPTDTPTGVEFVPMVWGWYGDYGNAVWAASQPGVKNILGFNEPDHPDQANLSVADALTGFATFKNSPVPVGSPAASDDFDSWMTDFMNGVSGNSSAYRMDFLTVHCYINDAGSFENYITNLHNTYWWLPLWITEFAPTTWGNPEGITADQASSFMQTVVPWLNSQWFVARYAWYTGASPGTWTLGTSALVNNDGTLTDLGKLYARM